VGADASVVIVNYRTAQLSVEAARSALDQGAARVVMVDNASDDGSLDAFRAVDDARVRVVANDRNAGFGTAANLGAASAEDDVLVFLNSDARLRPGSLATISEAVRRHAGRVLIGPRLVGEDGSVQRSAGLVPRPDDLAVRGLGAHRLARLARRLPVLHAVIGRSRIAVEYDQATTATSTIPVTMVSGACMAIGRAAFDELGGFDERYFMYFEDADLCRRATRAGLPILYVPEAVVEHIGGASSSGDYRFSPWHSASMIRYLREWHGMAGEAIGLMILWLRAIGHVVALRPSAGLAVSALAAGLAVARERS
jgi:GT2 family glycosyltransferase